MEETEKTKCPIFRLKDEEIKKITKAINKAEDVEKKASLAEKLVKEAEKLLFCKHFDKERAECNICHFIANWRKKTANLVRKAKNLKTNK